MKAKTTKPKKEYEPRPPIPKQFREYVSLVSSLADYEAWKVTRQFKKDSIEIKAYGESNQYRELKRIAHPHYLLCHPFREKFEGTSYRICIEIFWQQMRNQGVSESTIKIIDQAVEQHELEILDFKKDKREKRTKIKQLLNKAMDRLQRDPYQKPETEPNTPEVNQDDKIDRKSVASGEKKE